MENIYNKKATAIMPLEETEEYNEQTVHFNSVETFCQKRFT